MALFGEQGLLLAILVAVAILLAGSVEQEATGVTADASKYDLRTYTEADEYRGCSTTGCLPEYVLDGLLNDEGQSRWSCSEQLEVDSGIVECYITLDLQSSQNLSKMTIYFYESDDLSRETNPFNVSTSAGGTSFEFSFTDVNTAGVPIGEGEDFSFPVGATGRYVRLTGILAEDQWLSINEVDIFVGVATPAPVTARTPAPVTPSTPAPVNLPTPMPVSPPTRALLHPPTPAPLTTTPAPVTARTTAPIDPTTAPLVARISPSLAPTGAPVLRATQAPLAEPTLPGATTESPTPPVLSATLSPHSSTAPPTIEVYVTVATVAPTPSPANLVTVSPTSGGAPVASPTLTPSRSPTSPPTPAPTPIGGAECENVTVYGAGALSGVYTSVSGNFISTGTSDSTITSQVIDATCAGSSSDCSVTRWKIASDSSQSSYIADDDDAEHPSQIDVNWLRLYDCDSDFCQKAPADIGIVCGIGTDPAPTPAPSTLASQCGIIDMSGTILGELDGTYYETSELRDNVPQYEGYDSNLTSNGNIVKAVRMNGTCDISSSSTSGGNCSWREWQVVSSSTAEDSLMYFAFDEADHPVDISADSVWYTSGSSVMPYDGEVNFTCAPSTTPELDFPTPAPTADEGSGTVPFTGTDDDSDSSSSSTAVIAGSAAGGVALIALVGVALYVKLKTPPPPPSYDDLVQ